MTRTLTDDMLQSLRRKLKAQEPLDREQRQMLACIERMLSAESADERSVAAADMRTRFPKLFDTPPAPSWMPPEHADEARDVVRLGYAMGNLKAAEEYANWIGAQVVKPIGRPRKLVQARLAAQAYLTRDGRTARQVAAEICERRSDPFHRCGKRCADRLRKRAKAHLA